MAYGAGNDTRAYSNTGTIGTPIYTPLNCELSSSFSGTADYIDTTGKCSGNWMEGQAGTKSWTLTGDGKYVVNDAGVDQVRDNWSTGTDLLMQWKTFGGEVYSGNTVVTAFDVTSSYDSVVEFSWTVQGDGAISIA